VAVKGMGHEKEKDEKLRELSWLVKDLQEQSRQQAAKIEELEKANQYLVTNR
jgi:hypothetical protein